MFFLPCFKTDSRITIWALRRPRRRSSTASPGTSPPRSRRSRSASCRATSPFATPRRLSGRSARPDSRRVGHAPRPDARLPGHRRRYQPLLHPRPRARAGGCRRRRRAGVAIGVRARPRGGSPDPRLPVHRRGISRAHRVGHSPLHDALTFARRTEVERLVLFHHDPCTPTTSSTASATPRSSAGKRLAAARIGSNSPPSGPSSR